MKRNFMLYGCLFASILALTACADTTSDNVDHSNDDVVESSAEQGVDLVDIHVTSLETKYNDYFAYLRLCAGDENGVFSPESIDSAFRLYSYLLPSDTKSKIESIIGDNDHINYVNTSCFHTVNRLWLNEVFDVHPDAVGIPSDLVYKMDMSDSDKATAIKDTFVRDSTNGFIDKTPSVLDEYVIFDAMNVVYFKDSWCGGKFTNTAEPIAFHNADGTVSEVTMIRDRRSVRHDVYSTNDAISCTVSYAGGFTFNIVLPKDGKTLSDIDLNTFISGSAASEVYDEVLLTMPEFETNSFYQFDLNLYDITYDGLNPDFYEGVVPSPLIAQVAKIKVDKDGTEAAAVSEIISKNEAIGGQKRCDILCDRPFAYYIMDTQNNDVAFIGVVNTIGGD